MIPDEWHICKDRRAFSHKNEALIDAIAVNNGVTVAEIRMSDCYGVGSCDICYHQAKIYEIVDRCPQCGSGISWNNQSVEGVWGRSIYECTACGGVVVACRRSRLGGLHMVPTGMITTTSKGEDVI